MNYIPLSQAGDEYVKNLWYFEQKKQKYLQLDFLRANSCDLEIIFITTDELNKDKIRNNGLDEAVIGPLHEAWLEICHGKISQDGGAQKSHQIIEDHCARLINPDHEVGFLIRSFTTDTKPNQVLLFLGEGSWFPLDSLFMATRALKVVQGWIPIHMSAVLLKDELYLFGGPSGAGKSTVANLLTNEGGWLLDEDQVIIKRQKGGRYSASAWGYSMHTCEAPIRAVFQLIKDDCNAIDPLIPIQAASFLLRQAEQVVGWMLDDSIYSRLYNLTSELARKVPAYQLRFAQKGGLWPLIDELLNAESI